MQTPWSIFSRLIQFPFTKDVYAHVLFGAWILLKGLTVKNPHKNTSNPPYGSWLLHSSNFFPKKGSFATVFLGLGKIIKNVGIYMSLARGHRYAHRVYIFTRDETGLVYLPSQLERTLQLYWCTVNLKWFIYFRKCFSIGSSLTLKNKCLKWKDEFPMWNMYQQARLEKIYPLHFRLTNES